MDLSNFSIDPENQTATMDVLHPKTFAPITDSEGRKVTISLHGPDSKAQQDALRKNRNQVLKDGVKRRKLSLSAEQLEAQGLDLTVAATAGWENLAFEGEEPECTPENARKIYKALPWLREQVEEFIAERSNFLGE